MESSKRPFACLDGGEDGTRKRLIACVGGLEDLQAQR
jgi:hypothetical protein